MEAFYDCHSLKDVYCYAENIPSTSFYAFNYREKATLHVPSCSVENYIMTSPWNKYGKILPLDATLTINQYGSATYCSKYALNFSTVEGLKAYAATGYNNITGVVTLTRVMTAQPGEGLFIKGEPGEYKVPLMESTGDNTLNMLVGTLESTSINALSDDGLYANYKYTIKEGDSEPLFYPFADGSTLGTGKAYLRIPTAWLPSTGARSISYRFDEGEGTTDIEEQELSIFNSQQSIVYDLYGRKVENPVKGSIYIVNGKKIIY